MLEIEASSPNYMSSGELEAATEVIGQYSLTTEQQRKVLVLVNQRARVAPFFRVTAYTWAHNYASAEGR